MALQRLPMLHLPLRFLHQPAADHRAPPSLLVLMHGVGSNEQDLFSLAPQVPPGYHVLSLRAPYPMAPGANAWFNFSIGPEGLRSYDAAQEVASRAQVAETVTQAGSQLGVPAERVVVGGFSQGGIMSLSLLLTRPDLMAGAMVWHGRMLSTDLVPAAPGAALAGRALWISHGTSDDVIPLSHAHDMRDAVQPLPLALTYRDFPGAHGIHPQELAESMAWLEALRAAPSAA